MYQYYWLLGEVHDHLLISKEWFIIYALDGIDIYIVVIYHQIITNIYDKGWRKNVSYYSNIFGNASFKPNFGPYSSASDRPNFSQKIFGGASVRLKR